MTGPPTAKPFTPSIPSAGALYIRLKARGFYYPRNGKLVDAANRGAGWETNRWRALVGENCIPGRILVRKSPYRFLIECQFAESLGLHDCDVSCG